MGFGFEVTPGQVEGEVGGLWPIKTSTGLDCRLRGHMRLSLRSGEGDHDLVFETAANSTVDGGVGLEPRSGWAPEHSTQRRLVLIGLARNEPNMSTVG